MMRLLAVSIFILSACGARKVPESFPPAAAVTPDSPPAQAAVVGRVVSEDPPLPGEPLDGWPGLTAPADDHYAH